MAIAVVLGVGMEGTGVDGVDHRPVLGQPSGQQTVERMHLIFAEQTARDARLVGDDHRQIAQPIQPAHRRPGGWHRHAERLHGLLSGEGRTASREQVVDVVGGGEHQASEVATVRK